MNIKPGRKTIVLTIVTIFLIFGIFVVLPGLVPSLDSMSFNKLYMSCTNKLSEPIRYATYIWDDYAPASFPDTPIEDNVSVLENESDPSTSDASDQVFIPEVKELEGRISVTTNDNNDQISISGYLLFYSGGEYLNSFSVAFLKWQGGLQNKKLEVRIEGIYGNDINIEIFTLGTGKDGHFSLTYEFEQVPDCYYIYATFIDENYGKQGQAVMYTPSNALFSTCGPGISAEKRSINWGLIVLITLICSVIGLFAFIRVKQSKKPVRVHRDATIFVEELTEQNNKPDETEDSVSDMVLISFPEIEKDLPVVWDKEKDLRFDIHRQDTTNYDISVTVDWGDKDHDRTILEDSEVKSISHLYNNTGTFQLTLHFQRSNGDQSALTKTIRIVDYREEIVRLFNEMISSLNLETIEIGTDMTPRQLEKLLIRSIPNVSRETIRKVIDGFEEANYSTHPVNRENYVKMFLAIQQIIE